MKTRRELWIEENEWMEPAFKKKVDDQRPIKVKQVFKEGGQEKELLNSFLQRLGFNKEKNK